MVPMDGSLCEMQAEVFKAMGHPIRVRIVKFLADREHAVNEIVQAVQAEQSNVSRHLALLRQAGVLSSRKDGLRVFYRLSSAELGKALEAAAACVGDLMRSRVRAGASMLAETPETELHA